MDWSIIIGSALGGLVGGLFTFLGVFITIKHNEKVNFEKKREEMINNRPRLEIVNNSKEPVIPHPFLYVVPMQGVRKGKFLPEFEFEKEEMIKNYPYKDICLVNNGKTEIIEISFGCMDPEHSCLFAEDSLSMHLQYGVLNYEEYAKKRYIKPGESITFRIHFKKEFVYKSIYVFLHDINNRIWKQYLNFEYNEIENSVFIAYREYKDLVSVDPMMEMYKDCRKE